MDNEQRKEIVRQIGCNIWAISGGRVVAIDNGIEMNAGGGGYHVRVVLDASDTYTVSRVFKRAGKEFPKGSRSDVYCDEVSEVAYYASCFRSYDENEWMAKA